MRSYKNARENSRAEIIKLLNGNRTLHAKLGGARGATFNRIFHDLGTTIKDAQRAKEICSALTGLWEVDSAKFDHFHKLLQMALAVWDAGDGSRDLLASIRRAAARLDEVEYGALVPAE